MVDLTRFPNLLRLISIGYMARAALRRRRRDVQLAKRQRAEFYDRAWRSAADQLGADVDEVMAGVYEFQLGELRTAIRMNYTPLDDPVTLTLAGNKPFVHRRLRERNLPTPDYVEYSLKDLGPAVRFLEQTGKPCVVKPSGSTGAGQGITTGVRTRSQLAWASATAAKYGTSLLADCHVTGDNYRLLYLDGELLDAVKRNPPSVVGDGSSSIRTLLRRENEARATGWQSAQVLIHPDGEMNQTLENQGLSLRSIPEAGQCVILKHVINDNAARDNDDAANQLCPQVIEAGRRAANAIGVRLAGVDIITPDASKPLESVGGVILEINTTPGLYHHMRNHSCPVAATILEAAFDCKKPATATSF